VDLVRRSRPEGNDADGFTGKMVSWGAGPRASIYLILAAKARAILHGRYHATTEDVKVVAPPVMRHRLAVTFSAEASGLKPNDIVQRIVKEAGTVTDHA
jgi:MoxR-like ATPase